ncbi:hypothetical protein QJS10_CPA05g02119 [Acorus calamus]|uniref:Uncharacterized protein n=1 Tax=Acorus calamus TaxID=4465 RepID=A0AAV9EWQ3_ACOCL|nr:hypothetical protein QJS10_CPA05g02119 [Acorus calamus]
MPESPNAWNSPLNMEMLSSGMNRPLTTGFRSVHPPSPEWENRILGLLHTRATAVKPPGVVGGAERVTHQMFRSGGSATLGSLRNGLERVISGWFSSSSGL